MKKNKKIITVIIIALILIGGIIFLTANIMKDKKETSKNIEIIKYNYQELTNNVSEYNEIRKKDI